MNENKRLRPWEDACGRLIGIAEDYPYLVLDFGKFRVILGSKEADSIREKVDEEMIGKRISVLRTDLPDKPLLVREIGSADGVGA
jgi:hypothetical protein